MQKEITSLPGVILIHPDVYPDARGSFWENYNKQKLEALGITDDFIQDSISVSKNSVLRGLHFQKAPFAQSKLVSVIADEVFDVAVDIRPDSPNFGKWFGTTLSDKNHTMLYIPKGFAHGFYVLREAKFFYKLSGGYYNKDSSKGIIWNDPQLNIAWPVAGGQPILSTQDASLPTLATIPKEDL